MSAARVCVIAPSYNDGRFVREMMERISESEPIEMVVVDDGSTDPSSREQLRLTELAASQRQIHFRWFTQPNAGAGPALLRAAQEARAEFLFVIGADDLVFPGALTRAANALEADSTLDFVYGDFVQFGTQNQLMSTMQWDPWTMMQGNYCSAMMLIRKSVYLKLGGHQSRSLYEDWDFTLELAEQERRGLKLSGDPLWMYRVHPSGGRRWERESSEWPREFQNLKRIHSSLWDREKQLRAASALSPLHKAVLVGVRAMRSRAPMRIRALMMRTLYAAHARSFTPRQRARERAVMEKALRISNQPLASQR